MLPITAHEDIKEKLDSWTKTGVLREQRGREQRHNRNENRLSRAGGEEGGQSSKISVWVCDQMST